MRRDGATIRTERIREITKYLAARLKDKISIEKALVYMQVDVGLSENKAREYLGLILIRQGWIDSEGIITA